MFANRTRRAGCALFLLATALIAGGCSASKGHVTVTGDHNQAKLAQSFEQAYISASHDGEYDVILLQDDAASQKYSPTWGEKWQGLLKGKWVGDSQKPLDPVSMATLRQVVHIHVFWQASGGSVVKDGVVTNAAIDWYVLGNEATDHPELLHYEGAGYVLLDEGSTHTKVRIRDASMKKTEIRGQMTDPIGPSSLSGVIKAQRNTAVVKNILADVKAQTTTKTALSEAR